MKVTKIQQQVNRKDRYSIYIDELYSFSLHESQLIQSGLRLGKEFTQDELDTLKNESQFGKAYERVLNYILIRPRAEKEVKDYLVRTFLYPKPKAYVNKKGERSIKKREVDRDAVTAMIDKIMIKVRDKGYINDESFARAWIESRQMTKKSSTRRLEQELQQKGVTRDIIATVLQKVEINEIDNLRALVIKKRRLARYKDNKKLLPYLVRQGYSYDDVKKVINE